VNLISAAVFFFATFAPSLRSLRLSQTLLTAKNAKKTLEAQRKSMHSVLRLRRAPALQTSQTFNSVARNPFNPVTLARADAARLELRRAIVYE